MRIPYKEGEYIVKWNYYNRLENVHGCVISNKIIDENTIEYRVKLSDGSITTIIDDGYQKVTNYINYSSDLYYYADIDIENIHNAEEFLEKLLKDDFSKAREIAENCPIRTCPLKEGMEVIVYPICEKRHMVNEMKYVTIIRVDTIRDSRLPMYTVKNKDDNKNGAEFKVFGDYSNDIISDYSGFFIGTQDELVRLMVNMIDKTVEEVENIEELRKELYREVINTSLDNRDRKAMTKELDYSNPIQTSSMKK